MTEGNGYLDRSALLGRTERQYVTVELHDGRKVMLRTLTEGESARLEMAEMDSDGRFDRDRMFDRRVNSIIMHVVDPTSKKQAFVDSDRDDLRKMDARDAATLYDACLKLREVHVEKLEKKLEPADAS